MEREESNKQALPRSRTGKRGQITIYIALTLIVIALAITLFYMRSLGVKQELEAGVRRIVVAPESEPMQDYMTNCLLKVGTEGVQKLAEHGGYITVPGKTNRAMPTEAEAVTLSPDSDQAIPYWNFMSSKNDCTGTCSFSGLAPPIKKPAKDSMEEQLDIYIKENLDTCLDGFKPFIADNYIVTPLGQLSVSSTISDTTVAIYATYPIRFDRGGLTSQTNELFTTIPAKLGLMHKLAAEITKAQRDNRFLEKHIKQLVDLQSGVGKDQMPPIYEVEFRVGTGKTWAKSEVKKRLQDILSTYTPFLQVFGTSNFRKITPPRTGTDNEMFDRIYNRNMLVITSQDHSYPDLEARFIYLPWWEPYFDLNCQGELCRPESLINTLGLTYGIQRYMFSYDLSFPVMIELRDPTALSGKGLNFNFMLEGNLRNNKPLEGEFKPITMGQMFGDTLFCDPGQLTGTNASINLLDAKTLKPIERADILYTCGPAEHENSSSCSIGQTDSAGRLASMMPVCIGGTISIIKEGYLPKYMPFDTDEAVNRELRATLEPIRKIDLEVERIRLQKSASGWKLDDSPVTLDPYEEATVTMRRTGGPYDDQFFAMAQQLGDVIEDARSGSHTGVELVPGNYTVDITTIMTPGTPIVIPADKRCYEGQCVDVPKDPIVFDNTKPLPIGGASYTFEINKEDIDSGRTLRLYAIDVSLDLIPESDRKVEDLEQIGDTESLSETYRKQIQPIWVGENEY